ncbi:MAG: hypothetical protein MZV49_09545 [Rhodopseudomonas palustris]|nr:hypothetical protein [Rhodopseudomonas palustris]
MGISTDARRRAVVHAGGAASAPLSGMLIAPITTVYYDTGLPDRPEGLRRRHHRRAWRATRWPLAGALVVGLLGASCSFWASAFKEVIVFTLIIPVLLWRSLRDAPREEDERPRRGHPERAARIASAGRERSSGARSRRSVTAGLMRARCRGSSCCWLRRWPAGVHRHAAQLHRPVRAGGARPGAAHRRRPA